MESIRDLFIFFLKISAGIFVLVLVLILTNSITRGKPLKSTQATSTPKADILPSPRKYSGFFTSGTSSRTTAKEPEFTTFTYTGPIAFSSSSVGNPINVTYGNQTNTNSYNTYTNTNQQQPTGTALQDNGTTRISYVRNLSMYEGGHVYTGFSFVGEAKSSMFRDGKFPIVIVDGAGKFIGVSAAVAQTNWTVPGWVRFETKVTYPLPNNVPCTMIFEEALTQVERTRAPLRVSLPIRCN